jgi:hypothetical protein
VGPRVGLDAVEKRKGLKETWRLWIEFVWPRIVFIIRIL